MLARSLARGTHQTTRSLRVQRSSNVLAELRSRARAPTSRNVQQRTASTAQNARALFRQQPVMMSLLTVSLTCIAGYLLYLPFWFEKYQIRPYSAFPEEVSTELRKAIAYQHEGSEPKKALRHYQLALTAAEETGMDPFSNEVLGIKVALAAFLEQYYDFQGAINVLGIVRSDCVKWEQNVGHKHWSDGKRTRVLEMAIKVSIKMGELYGMPWVGETDKAEEALTWAVDTALREGKRREDEGVKEGEGAWLSNEALGGAMEALGHFYETKNIPSLSAPLFLKALTLCPSDTCHAVVLMNNIASAFAAEGQLVTKEQPKPSNKSFFGFSSSSAPPQGLTRQHPRATGPTQPSFAVHGANDTSSSIQSGTEAMTPAAQAISWARAAVTAADRVPAELRNEECDQAKCAALYNLGELSERQRSLDSAIQSYRKAKQLAQTIGFEEGVKMASESLERLKS